MAEEANQRPLAASQRIRGSVRSTPWWFTSKNRPRSISVGVPPARGVMRPTVFTISNT
jgi:hypothetical protein